MNRRALRRATIVLVAAALAVVPASSASASPGLDAAKKKAAVLRKAVAALEEKAAVAVEDYNEANDALSRAVGARLEAQAQLDAAERAAKSGSDVVGERVRSIYMTGGSMALYASVLSAPDLHDAFGRIANVSSVLRADNAAVDAAAHAVDRAEAAAAKLREIALRQTKLEKQVAAATLRIETALAEQKALLAQADATVLRIAEADRIAAEQAAARAFAERLAAARGVTDTTTYVYGTVLPSLAADSTLAPNATAAAAVAAARTQLGKPYVWGAVGPASFDCSGLTGWAYKQAGVNLPRTSRQQWFAGTHPPLADLAPGDLLFWGSNASNPQSIHHVALYIGGGMMIAAPHTGAVVRIQPVYQTEFFGVTRPSPPGGQVDNAAPVT